MTCTLHRPCSLLLFFFLFYSFHHFSPSFLSYCTLQCSFHPHLTHTHSLSLICSGCQPRGVGPLTAEACVPDSNACALWNHPGKLFPSYSLPLSLPRLPLLEGLHPIWSPPIEPPPFPQLQQALYQTRVNKGDNLTF